MHLAQVVFLFLAALLAGTLNAIVGGGSFVSFPALLFIGIPPISANATNTAGLWPGMVASASTYRHAFSGKTLKLLPPLVLTGLIGGLVGARILLRTPPATFMRLVPWLLLGGTLIFARSAKISAWIRGRSAGYTGSSRLEIAGAAFLQLLLAVYIGYFGAGVGILILALLAVMGVPNIHAMNGLRTLLVSVANATALATFILAKAVVWPPALLMVVGASLGGYGGAYYAQRMNPERVRRFVIAVGLAMSLYFFIHH